MRIIFLIIFAILPALGKSKEVVLLPYFEGGKFSRFSYPREVIKLALEKTKIEFGDFELALGSKMSRNRALEELIAGRIHVHSAPTRNEWEEKAIPIYFPILKGLLNYRLLLIRASDHDRFKSIKTLSDLKKLKAGLGSQWSTTKVFNHLGINVETGDSYKGLFNMLDHKRFDYFPRGINEIFGELENQKIENIPLEIEEGLALYIPLPWYIFVSPKKPKLAKRIEKGLRAAVKDGSFEKIFLKHHGDVLNKANLSNRNIIHIGNPLLKKHPIFDEKNLWLTP